MYWFVSTGWLVSIKKVREGRVGLRGLTHLHRGLTRGVLRAVAGCEGENGLMVFLEFL
jgi:hypothetical protein